MNYHQVVLCEKLSTLPQKKRKEKPNNSCVNTRKIAYQTQVGFCTWHEISEICLVGTPVSLFARAHDFSLYAMHDLFSNYFVYCNFREQQLQLETWQLQTLLVHDLSQWRSKWRRTMMMW
jgi:hypothetical protein